MSYDLLEKAPKDHLSDEFLQFLRENNKVVKEDGTFLIIENCKYHTPERPWYTAFNKCTYGCCDFRGLESLMDEYPDFTLMVKPITERSVQRFHAHLVKKPLRIIRALTPPDTVSGDK